MPTDNAKNDRCDKPLKGRPHTFINTCFKIELSKPRWKNFNLDTCLTSRSLVSKLVLLSWTELSVSNSDWKRFKPKKEWPTLETNNSSKLGTCQGPKPYLPLWLAKLSVKTGGFERGWPLLRKAGRVSLGLEAKLQQAWLDNQCPRVDNKLLIFWSCTCIIHPHESSWPVMQDIVFGGLILKL